MPVRKGAYLDAGADPRPFHAWLDQAVGDHPQPFPAAFADGYRLQDQRRSAPTGLRLRRLRLQATAPSFCVRPSFALPDPTGLADHLQTPLLLRSFGLPFAALARVFGTDAHYGYRRQVGPAAAGFAACRVAATRCGRHRIVGTSLGRARWPEPLLADEHHPPRDGVKNSLATPVGGGGCRGAARTQTASAEDGPAAYAVFQRQTQDVRPTTGRRR